MKEDVIAANLANLRQSVNELKETVNKLNVGSQNHEQAAQSPVDERKEQPDKIPFSIWIPKLIDLLKRKFSLIDYLYISCLRLQHESLEDRS